MFVGDPEITHISSNVQSFKGDDIILSCSAISWSTPWSISWKFKSRTLKVTSVSEKKKSIQNTLRIKDASLKDAGTYTCNATSKNGTFERNVNVVIYGK